MSALFEAWLHLQVGIGVAWLISRAAAVLGASSRQVVRISRALALVAVLVAVVVALGSSFITWQGPFTAPAQVWTGPDGTPLLTIGGTSTPSPAALPQAAVLVQLPDPRWIAGAVVALSALSLTLWLAAMAQLWLAVRRTVGVRHLGSVDVRVGGRGAPWSAYLPGRHVIVLDADTWSNPQQRRLSVLHELQHHRHHDPFMAHGWLLLLMICLPNPFAWLLHRMQNRHEELACDSALIQRSTVDARTYGRCLVSVAERAISRPAVMAVGLHPGATRSPLHERIAMLLTPKTSRSIPLLPVTLFAGLLMAAVAVASDSLVDDNRPSDASISAARTSSASTAFSVPDHPAVHKQVQRFAAEGRANSWMKESIERRGVYKELIETELQRASLPPQLMAVALIESGFTNMGTVDHPAPPKAPGRGLWMFIEPTAQQYGLQVDATIDERLDPVLETRAAMSMLADLHGDFGDWGLALAAYNQGSRKVHEAIRDEGTRDAMELSERGALNNYVPTVMAGVLFLQDPSLLGN